MEYNGLRDLMRESFGFLARQKYPAKDITTPLRAYLETFFDLKDKILFDIAAFAVFYFINTKDSLAVNTYLRNPKDGSIKPISFKLKDGFDLDKIVEESLPLAAKKFESMLSFK